MAQRQLLEDILQHRDVLSTASVLLRKRNLMPLAGFFDADMVNGLGGLA